MYFSRLERTMLQRLQPNRELNGVASRVGKIIIQSLSSWIPDCRCGNNYAVCCYKNSRGM